MCASLPAEEADQFFSQHPIISRPTHPKNRTPTGGVSPLPLSPPCIPPKPVLHGLSARSKFLAVRVQTGCWHLCWWSFLDRPARSQYRAGTEHCSLRSFLRDWTSRPSPKVRNKNALVLKTRWLRPARFLVNQDSFSKLCSNGERQSSPLHAQIIRCIYSMKGLRSPRGIE